MKLITVCLLVTLPKIICFTPKNCKRFCNGIPHTECYPQGGGDDCQNNEKVYLSSDEKRFILAYHNNKRSLVAAGLLKGLNHGSNMMKLVWQGEMGMLAKRWADQCLEGPHDQCRTAKDGTETGQNSYVGRYKNTGAISNKKITERYNRISMMLDTWFNEIHLVNHTDIKSYDGKLNLTIGNVTQMIWAETIYIACGYTEFTEKDDFLMFRFICDYKGTGNVNGKAVYLEGSPCSKCPSGSNCSESVTTLCFNGESNDFVDGNEAHINKPAFYVTGLFTLIAVLRFFSCAVDK